MRSLPRKNSRLRDRTTVRLWEVSKWFSTSSDPLRKPSRLVEVRENVGESGELPSEAPTWRSHERRESVVRFSRAGLIPPRDHSSFSLMTERAQRCGA